MWRQPGVSTHTSDMANPSKRKGDQAELDAVAYIVDQTPRLVVPRPQRKLGAGRREDTGDLHVFADTAVQVRNWKLASIGGALRSAAHDSVIQAGNDDLGYAVGMVPYPGARQGTVRWIATWAPGHGPTEVRAEFKIVSKALTWLRDDTGPYGYMVHPRLERIGHLGGPGEPILIAPFEAWLGWYANNHTLVAVGAA